MLPLVLISSCAMASALATAPAPLAAARQFESLARLAVGVTEAHLAPPDDDGLQFVQLVRSVSDISGDAKRRSSRGRMPTQRTARSSHGDYHRRRLNSY